MKNKELGLNDKMTFGKHKGSTIKYLIENEPFKDEKYKNLVMRHLDMYNEIFK